MSAGELGQVVTIAIIAGVLGTAAFRAGRRRAATRSGMPAKIYDRSPFKGLVPIAGDTIRFVDPNGPEAMAREFGPRISLIDAALDGAKAAGVDVTIEATSGAREVWVRIRNPEAETDEPEWRPIADAFTGDEVANGIWDALDIDGPTVEAQEILIRQNQDAEPTKYWLTELDEKCDVRIRALEGVARAVDVTIRRLSDGAERVFVSSFYEPDYPTSAIIYMWSSGNYGCDCNRSIFWNEAGGEPRDDQDDSRPCGSERFALSRLIIRAVEATP